MAFYVPWLADAARMTGYPVVEVGGWRTRGHGGMRVVDGVVPHHTADGSTGDYPSLRIVRDGRAGLAGPLSQFGLGRTGTIYVIAAGQSWHAGASAWAGFWDLNDEFLGIEAESVGTRNDWTAAQRDCYPRLCAALLHFMRRGVDRLGAHKEVCRPQGRKIDPAYWDMDGMRAEVGRYLAHPPMINRYWKEDDVTLSDAQDKRLAIIEKQVASMHHQLTTRWNNPGPPEGPGHGTLVEGALQSHHMLTGELDYTTWRDGEIGPRGNHYEHTMAVRQRLDALATKIDQLLAGGGSPNP